MSLFPETLCAQAAAFISQCSNHDITVATVESCTGGLLAALLTEVPGSSNVFTFGFIPYANAAKTALLAVPHDDLAQHGAVSEETAIAMAKGALHRSNATVSLAITGIAGPGGGTPEKPVGLVYMASAHQAKDVVASRYEFAGDRSQVRLQSVAAGLTILQQQIA